MMNVKNAEFKDMKFVVKTTSQNDDDRLSAIEVRILKVDETIAGQPAYIFASKQGIGLASMVSYRHTGGRHLTCTQMMPIPRYEDWIRRNWGVNLTEVEFQTLTADLTETVSISRKGNIKIMDVCIRHPNTKKLINNPWMQ